jgi:hypothetical protein
MIEASADGAQLIGPTLRVTFWGALGMGLTTAIRAFVGKAV